MDFTLSTKPLLPTPVKLGTAFNGAGSDATAPFILSDVLSVSQIFLYPILVVKLHQFIGPNTKQCSQLFMIDQNVLFSGFLDFTVAAKRPLRRMIYNTGTNHVHPVK